MAAWRMNHFCTYCDSGYAARLLCLHDSLRAQGEPFVLHVLCFDETSAAVVTAVGAASLVPVTLDEILHADPEFAAVRSRRSRVEFFFTATPVLVRHCFNRAPAAGWMTYLDADLFFFGPASALLQEQRDASVGIVPHRFPPRLRHLEDKGRYNVAWVSFRRDADGLACLEWWRERCLEWCHDRVDHGRYADQGYLNEFPARSGRVHVITHAGADLAPWNVDDVQLDVSAGGVGVDGQPLLFYHFQGLREVLPGWFDPGLRSYGSRMTRELRELVYRPYLARLVATQQRLERDHGLAPQRGYRRLVAGDAWRERWQRVATNRLLPLARLLRGRLLHASARAVAPSVP